SVARRPHRLPARIEGERAAEGRRRQVRVRPGTRAAGQGIRDGAEGGVVDPGRRRRRSAGEARSGSVRRGIRRADHGRDGLRPGRSEEHTSELQSHLKLVCRLLLEKKKRRHHLTRAESKTRQELRRREAAAASQLWTWA